MKIMLFLQYCALSVLFLVTLSVPSSCSQNITGSDAPIVTLQLGDFFHEDSLKEGDDMYFVCQIKANPPSTPPQITWERNGIKIENNYHEGIITAGESLVLQRISSRVNGRYTCKASNDVGVGVSQPYNLQIKHKPACKIYEPQLVIASMQQSVEIECGVYAYPPPDAFRWTFNSSFKGIVQLGEGKSVLSYSPELHGYGTIQCWAANREGQQSTPCTFDILPPLVPKAPRSCVLNTVDTQYRLSCIPDAANENKAFITFKAEILTKEGTKVLKPMFWPDWELKEFDASGVKEIVVYATNLFGESKQTFAVETVYRLTPTNVTQQINGTDAEARDHS